MADGPENYRAVAEAFVNHYYATFDENRNNLATLYRDNSMLTFESDDHQGGPAIVAKLASLPFQKVKHLVSTRDPQPILSNGEIVGVLVLVTGQLQVDEEERPMNYTQVFQLMKDGATYFVYNDIFKLVFG